jgi:RNA 3'-terminal phosphate cyclase (ATP)
MPARPGPERPGGPSPLALDASHGEGGGQILRTALGLAVALGRPVTLDRIRIRRPKPGLQPQHLTVVRALAEIADAEVVGGELGSTALSFSPRGIHGGTYRFDVGAIKGSAGSAPLLFQALVLPLALAHTGSQLCLVGGTHVPWSPPFQYLSEVYVPVLREAGLEAALTLRRWGWYPRGGGEVEAVIRPARALRGLAWDDRPSSLAIQGLSGVSGLPASIALRQRGRALERLREHGLDARIDICEDATALGQGTVLFLAAAGPGARAGFSALGRRGLPAEAVADQAVEALLAYLASGAAVDDHLADQLVPILALATTPSRFTCPTVSSHLETVAWVVEQFLPVRVTLAAGAPARVEIVPAATRCPGSAEAGGARL